MQVVIDIPEEMISLIKDKSVECFNVVHYGQVLDAIYNGTPIPDNATTDDAVLDKIRDEIKQEYDNQGDWSFNDGLAFALEIIDKYTKGEFEQKNKGNKFFSKYLSDYLDRIEKENERLDKILSDEIEKLANK